MSETTDRSVLVSDRVRLARNYHDLPFSTAREPESALLCIQRAREAMESVADEYVLHQLNAMPQQERQKLVERHLISRDLLKNADSAAALIRTDTAKRIAVETASSVKSAGARPKERSVPSVSCAAIGSNAVL